MALDLNPANGPVSRGRIIAVCALIILLSEIATFEILMVYPALPGMAAHFRTLDVAQAASVVTLAGAVVLPLAGKAADRYGKKRIILVMGAIFLLGSILCATTDVFAVLLIGRLLQGSLVGIVNISYALVRDVIPRSYVPIALGSVVTGIGMGAVAGPFLAGALIDNFGFRSVFWFMVIYVGVLLPLHAWLVPESTVRVKSSFDILGAILLGASLGVLLVAVGKGGTWGWGSTTTVGAFGLGVLLLAAFVLRELKAKEPLIDLRVLVGRKFLPTVVAVGLVSYMMNAHGILSPTMFETPHIPGNTYGVGLSALQLALWTFPLGVVGMVVGPLGGYLSKRIGARQVLLASSLCFLVVMVLGSRMFTVQWQVAITSFVAGFAVGFLHSSNANLLQDALPARLGGAGNCIAGVIAMLASSAAVTVTGAIMAGHVRMTLPQSHAVIYGDAAFTQSYLWAGVVGVVGVAIILVMKHGRKPAEGGLVEESDTAARVAVAQG